MLRAYCCASTAKKDTRALLAMAFRQLYGSDMPRVEKDDNGKPYFPFRQDVHFSLSHTKTHVMIVIGDLPCGCDIETVRHVRAGLPERVCSPEELSHFDFFQCWVLKESFIKLSGNTSLPLDKTCFSLENGRIITPDSSISAMLYECPGCRAAVCCAGDPPEKLEIVPLKILRCRT